MKRPLEHVMMSRTDIGNFKKLVRKMKPSKLKDHLLSRLNQ
jgi:hypothetical protein